MEIPRVAAIHDLSGFGRCSLAVVLPVLSAMGVQCCPLPTAVLSTHTGGFEGVVFLDMTDQMLKAAHYWNALQLQFQAIYSGFLGSERQIDVVKTVIHMFQKEHTVVVVDPVMGDHGKVYQTYTPAMCAGMKHLTELADVITPNLTEAALLLDIPYTTLAAKEIGYREIVEQLSLQGNRSVVLTGVSAAPETTGAMCFDAETGKTDLIQTCRIAREFPGSGDIFTSILTGALVQGVPLPEATRQAAEFVLACAEYTARENLPLREGMIFEPLLRLLMGTQP